jgi:hypothetical protein
MQTEHNSIRNRPRAAGSDDVLQIRSHRQPRRDLNVIVNLRDAFKRLNAHGARRQRVAVLLIFGQARVDTGIGEQNGNEISIAVLESALTDPACANEVSVYRRRPSRNPGDCAYTLKNR